MKVFMFVLNNCNPDTRVLKEAKTLAENGHIVTIIAIHDKGDLPSEYRDGVRIIRIALGRMYQTAKQVVGRVDKSYPKGIIKMFYFYKVFRLLVDFIGRPFVIVNYSWAAWRVVRGNHADVYHSHDLDTLPIGYIASRRTKGKLVYDAHELYTELRYVPKAQRIVFRLIESILVHRLDAMVTTNEPVAALYSQRYGIRQPIVLMNCPVYKPHDGYNRNDGLRAALSIASSQPIIIYSGGLQRDRGLEQMIAAMSLLGRGILVFLGWGYQEQLLRNLVVERELTNRVLFYPPVIADSVPEFISSADVGIICTQNSSLNNYYTSPNKLFEYVVAGLPVVASDFPFLRHIIENYHIGKVCNPTNPLDIAESLDWVLSNKRRHQTLKEHAQKATMVLNWGNESKKLVGIYEGLSSA